MYYGIQGYLYEKVFKEYKVFQVNIPDKDLHDKVFLAKALENKIKIPKVILIKYRIKSILKLIISILVSGLLSLAIPIYILFMFRNTKKEFNSKNLSKEWAGCYRIPDQKTKPGRILLKNE